jgi:ABC-type lipoprotein export system ATPase subunit
MPAPIMGDTKDTKGVDKDPASPAKAKYGLRVVEDCESSTRERDIVAIHGISGNAKSTWSVLNEPDRLWLSEAYPKSRILLYAYDTSQENETWFTESGIATQSLNLLVDLVAFRDREPREQHKPLVFVSHDVGGALVKAVSR